MGWHASVSVTEASTQFPPKRNRLYFRRIPEPSYKGRYGLVSISLKIVSRTKICYFDHGIETRELIQTVDVSWNETVAFEHLAYLRC